MNKHNTKGSLQPTPGSTTANWNGGTASSGNPGADLVTIGGNDLSNILQSLIVDMSNLTAAATIDVRFYAQVNGTEKEIWAQDFVVGTDPEAPHVINSSMGINEAVRVEVYSDDALDDGAAIPYEYLLEAR